MTLRAASDNQSPEAFPSLGRSCERFLRLLNVQLFSYLVHESHIDHLVIRNGLLENAAIPLPSDAVIYNIDAPRFDRFLDPLSY